MVSDSSADFSLLNLQRTGMVLNWFKHLRKKKRGLSISGGCPLQINDSGKPCTQADSLHVFPAKQVP